MRQHSTELLRSMTSSWCISSTPLSAHSWIFVNTALSARNWVVRLKSAISAVSNCVLRLSRALMHFTETSSMLITDAVAPNIVIGSMGLAGDLIINQSAGCDMFIEGHFLRQVDRILDATFDVARCSRKSVDCRDHFTVELGTQPG